MPTNSIATTIVAGNTSVYTSNTIWVEWNNVYSTSTSITSPTIITSANSTNCISTSSGIWTIWNQNYIISPPCTPANNAEYAARLARDRAEAEKAKGRAEVLLQEALNAKQREELSQKGFFSLDVLSTNGQRRQYRIRRGRSRNVQQVDPVSGNVLKHLCAHPRELVPDADTMLAQKLMLETAEDDFLRIANHS